ncbi:hypothetical protein [Rheinheimera salexigens]|nr:hypothetical protein [Rheinheimera salexigens]
MHNTTYTSGSNKPPLALLIYTAVAQRLTQLGVLQQWANPENTAIGTKD